MICLNRRGQGEGRRIESKIFIERSLLLLFLLFPLLQKVKDWARELLLAPNPRVP